MTKIAFLFLTIDNIHFPEIWERYFNDNLDKISIYCHPKYPDKVTISWLKKGIISNLVETGWGYITNAYFNLLSEAIRNKDNLKFITVSESCIPITNFNDLYNKLISDDPKTSYIKFMKISKYDFEARIQSQKNYKKYEPFYKHYARFCLSRHHVKKLLVRKNDFNFFNKMHVADEFFLSLLHPFKNVKDFAITYDNWDDIKYLVDEINKIIRDLYKRSESTNDNNLKSELLIKIHEFKKIKQNINKNPRSYDKVSIYDIKKAKKMGSFFWRKFPKDSNIIEFKNKIF